MNGMENKQEPINPPVLFNMDLANGPTSERFCREAVAILNGVFDDTYLYDDEGSFSWSSCDSCRRPYGGERYPASMFKVGE